MEPLHPQIAEQLARDARTCDRQSDECSGEVAQRGVRTADAGRRVIVRICDRHSLISEE